MTKRKTSVRYDGRSTIRITFSREDGQKLAARLNSADNNDTMAEMAQVIVEAGKGPELTAALTLAKTTK